MVQLALAEWRMVGPYGGSADIIRAARTGCTVVAGTRNAQIYVSRDCGESWQPVGFPLEFRVVLHALEIDPTNARSWYAGVEEEQARHSGIYHTSDEGKS